MRSSFPDSCGHASGSESEVGDDSEGEAVQQRRMRTKFTTEQIRKLESSFSKHRYLSASQRRKIAEKLNLSETQVGLGSCLQRVCSDIQGSLRKKQNKTLAHFYWFWCSPV